MAVLAINTYTQTITPATAKAWLGFKYAHQRNIDTRTVAVLALAMQRKRFTTNTMKFALLRDGRYLINGQHTLMAVIQSNTTIVLPVQDFVVETDEDVASLYYHEDTNRRRSFHDSVRAIEFVDRLGISQTQIKQVAAALRWAKANFGAERNVYDYITQDDLLEWVPMYRWEINAIYQAISPCTKEDRNLIIKQSVLAVGLITMRYAPDKASEFWSQVAKDDGLERYDPRKTIRSWLITNSIRKFAHEGIKVRGTEVSRAVALAWNAWCDNRTLRFTIVRDTTKPLELRHCGPFNGNQSPNYVPLTESPNMAHPESVRVQHVQAPMAAVAA